MKVSMRYGFRFVGIGLLILVGAPLTVSSAQASPLKNASTNHIFVGEHLHTMSVMGNRFFVTGHEGAGRSDDGGKSWISMASLNGADIMSWTSSSSTIFAGGHFGLFRSTDKGATFKKLKFYGSISDVHAIGASGKFVYLGSPQVGLLMSSDGGVTWKMRNAKVGQGFMGSMLVDPKDPKRIIAPDMAAGLVVSADGGLTWKSFGGPPGPMAVAWNGKNLKEIAAIGMMTSGISSNGGKSWTEMNIPSGAAAIEYSADGKKLLVATLVGTKAQIYSSVNHGKSWQSSTSSSVVKKVVAMDPNMPGMDHSAQTVADRPIALTLGTFGFGTSAVFISAVILRKKDRAKIAAKKSMMASRGVGK